MPHFMDPKGILQYQKSKKQNKKTNTPKYTNGCNISTIWAQVVNRAVYSIC